MRVAKFAISTQKSLHLILNKGSVVDFHHSNGAIVNAANEGCLGGGGVDGAISKAGGEQLYNDRLALPIVSPYCHRSSDDDFDEEKLPIRCPVGDSKITGPNSDNYGTLGVKSVIHSVGPNYWEFMSRYEEADNLLRSAYTKSLVRAEEAQLESIAFCLLSAGVFKGRRSLIAVLRIGIEAICQFEGYHHLKEVHVFGFNDREVKTLLHVTSDEDTLKEISEADNDDTDG